ncbi:MAG: pyridoxine 5'-phosphate synthase, partial [Asticcacaulis sp.]
EFHVGALCDALREGDRAVFDSELERLKTAAALAESLGIEVHAGHGIDYDTVPFIAALPQVRELNIGHFLIGEAIFTGLDAAVARMRGLMDQARP